MSIEFGEFVIFAGIILFLLGAWYQGFTFGSITNEKMDRKTDAMMVIGFLIILLGGAMLIGN